MAESLSVNEHMIENGNKARTQARISLDSLITLKIPPFINLLCEPSTLSTTVALAASLNVLSRDRQAPVSSMIS